MKTRVKISENVFMVSEEFVSDEFRDISIWLEDDKGVFIQDLVRVSPSYSVEDNEIKFSENNFAVRIWSDEFIDDYTREFTIPLVEY